MFRAHLRFHLFIVTIFFLSFIGLRYFGASQALASQKSGVDVTALAPWYDTRWAERQSITIWNSGETMYNYQIQITVPFAELMKDNFDDIRFTKSDGVSLLPFWFSEVQKGYQLKVWVKVPELPARAQSSIYMYYGNSEADVAANAEAVFPPPGQDLPVAVEEVEKDNNPFRGMWFANYDFYHGPMATYSDKQRPMAIYAEAVRRTFFAYGGADEAVYISYYDHDQQYFAHPVKLGNLEDGNGHRNPSLLIDEQGYIYAFYGSHNSLSTTKRSIRPYDMYEWEQRAAVDERHTYPQSWQLLPEQIFHLYRGRGAKKTMFRTSTNAAQSWSDFKTVVDFGDQVVYPISIAESGGFPRSIHVVWTVLDLNSQIRKHFWYAYSDDGGETWKRANGSTYTLPIKPDTAEKIYDSGENQVQTNDIRLDSRKRPYILGSVGLGMEDGSWSFICLKYEEGRWQSYQIAKADHQFDTGALVIVNDDDFRAYLPTGAVQSGEDGGAVEEWQSLDRGETWHKTKNLTPDAVYSHNYVRTVYNGQPDFRVYWSYGDSRMEPESKEVSLWYYGENQTTAEQIVPYPKYRQLVSSVPKFYFGSAHTFEQTESLRTFTAGLQKVVKAIWQNVRGHF